MDGYKAGPDSLVYGTNFFFLNSFPIKIRFFRTIFVLGKQERKKRKRAKQAHKAKSPRFLFGLRWREAETASKPQLLTLCKNSIPLFSQSLRLCRSIPLKLKVSHCFISFPSLPNLIRTFHALSKSGSPSKFPIFAHPTLNFLALFSKTWYAC